MVNGDAYNTFFCTVLLNILFLKNLPKHFRTLSNNIEHFFKTCFLFFSGCVGEESCGVGEGVEVSEAEGGHN